MKPEDNPFKMIPSINRTPLLGHSSNVRSSPGTIGITGKFKLENPLSLRKEGLSEEWPDP